HTHTHTEMHKHKATKWVCNMSNHLIESVGLGCNRKCSSKHVSDTALIHVCIETERERGIEREREREREKERGRQKGREEALARDWERTRRLKKGEEERERGRETERQRGREKVIDLER